MARIQTSSLMESLPEFPAALFLAGASPTAVVSVSVDAAGVPTGATVDLSSGDIDVDSAICGVVRSWRFDPELRDGLPVASNEVITLNFELASDAR